MERVARVDPCRAALKVSARDSDGRFCSGTRENDHHAPLTFRANYLAIGVGDTQTRPK